MSSLNRALAYLRPFEIARSRRRAAWCRARRRSSRPARMRRRWQQASARTCVCTFQGGAQRQETQRFTTGRSRAHYGAHPLPLVAARCRSSSLVVVRSRSSAAPAALCAPFESPTMSASLALAGAHRERAGQTGKRRQVPSERRPLGVRSPPAFVEATRARPRRQRAIAPDERDCEARAHLTRASQRDREAIKRRRVAALRWERSGSVTRARAGKSHCAPLVAGACRSPT